MRKREIGSKVKTFVEDHKTELIISGVGVVAVAGVVIVKRNEIQLLKDANRLLKMENGLLEMENGLLEMENACLRQSRAKLITRCDEKDVVFIRTISDGLRHGSPEAARQMAYRKEYLQAAKSPRIA